MLHHCMYKKALHTNTNETNLFKDFGKYPLMKKLVQDYIQALHSHNGSEDVIRNFVAG